MFATLLKEAILLHVVYFENFTPQHGSTLKHYTRIRTLSCHTSNADAGNPLVPNSNSQQRLLDLGGEFRKMNKVNYWTRY